MRITDFRYKSWKKRRDLSIWKKRLLRNEINNKRRDKNKTKYKENEMEVFWLPENFSIIDNADEVIKTFSNIKNRIRINKFIKTVRFEMSKVTHVTVDALMYLLAFIKNLSSNSVHPIRLSGNMPRDLESRQVVVSSGFLKYLRSTIVSEYSDENVHIVPGEETDPGTISKICDFVQNKLDANYLKTKLLYNTLGEIIGNATEHAYDGGAKWNKWLLFSKYKNNRIRIVVLDTGFGIIKTVTRRLGDRVNVFKDNKDLLRSALRGEKRSATRLGYRNKGLPRIISNAKTGYFEKLSLFTNDVSLELEYNKKEVCKSLDSVLNGTLYYLELSKESINENDRNI